MMIKLSPKGGLYIEIPLQTVAYIRTYIAFLKSAYYHNTTAEECVLTWAHLKAS